MNIILSSLGKRYNREWIFRKLDYTFQSPGKYAITGPNGSGKSTLLQVISGVLQHNEGEIIYRTEERALQPETIYRHVSLAAPYLDLVEEMTLLEFLHFHQNTKGWIPGLNLENLIRELQLEKASHKQIRYFSSGMKQRVKLAQALLSEVPLILLDEPLTNLDTEGIQTYYHLIEQYAGDRLVIVSSNDPQEYKFCEETLNIAQYK